jgi:hypothetical protein
MNKYRTSISVKMRDLEGLTSSERNRIKEFLDNSDNTTIFHTFEWQERLVKYLGKKVFVAIGTQNDKIKGLIFLSLERKKGFIKYFYSPPRLSETLYGGPIIVDNRFKTEIAMQMIEGLKQFKNSYFNITFLPDYDKVIFKKNSDIFVVGTTSVINMKASKDELWAGLKKNCRWSIRNARKHDVTVNFGGVENLEEFYNLLDITYSRHPIEIKPIDFYESIIKLSYPENSRIYLARQGEKCIGGVFLLFYNDVGYYWLGGSLKEHNKINPNNLIQWEIIKYLSENGFSSYDLLNLSIPSIARYKRSFGGTDVEFYTVTLRTDILKSIDKIKSKIFGK